MTSTAAPSEEATQQPGTALALLRPEDIKDAVDGTDLLDSLVEANKSRVKKKVDKRVVQRWIEAEKRLANERYYAKAKEAYEKVWALCGGSTVGHEHRTIEVRGTNVLICNDCGFHEAYSREGTNASAYRRIADEMNRDTIKIVAQTMIEKDIEADLFHWPTYEDYPNIVPKQTLLNVSKGEGIKILGIRIKS